VVVVAAAVSREGVLVVVLLQAGRRTPLPPSGTIRGDGGDRCRWLLIQDEDAGRAQFRDESR
jgi:hypothetical protein